MSIDFQDVEEGKAIRRDGVKYDVVFVPGEPNMDSEIVVQKSKKGYFTNDNPLVVVSCDDCSLSMCARSWVVDVVGYPEVESECGTYTVEAEDEYEAEGIARELFEDEFFDSYFTDVVIADIYESGDC